MDKFKIHMKVEIPDVVLFECWRRIKNYPWKHLERR